MLVFRPFVEMINDNTDGIWNNSADHCYAVMLADGGVAPDRAWTTMSDVLGAGGWSRAAGSTDAVMTAPVRQWRYNTSAAGSFPANTMVYGFYDQINFGIVTAGTSLGAICVYWDSTNGANRQDSTNRILWWDDSAVDSAVTSTGENRWGAGASTNDCVGMQALTSTPNAYVMGSGMQEMQSEAALWQSGASQFALRLYQNPAGSPIAGPSDVSTISQVDALYPRAQAQGGGDVADITVPVSARYFTWDPSPSIYNWNYDIDPFGSALSFGLVAAGQTLDGVALYNTVTGTVWYWDAAFLDVNLVSDTTITYGAASRWTAFSYRLLAAS